MKFSEIPPLTRHADYRVNVPWEYVEKTLESYNETGMLQLDPPFQRAHVWNDEQRSRYVEYILRGGQSSRDIYFNQSDWMGKFQAPMFLVDGKQRLYAIRLFLNNDLPAFGSYLSDFEDRLPLAAQLVFHVNTLPDYRSVLRWYIDLNAGGVAHTTEEIAIVRDMLAKEQLKLEALKHG